MTDWKDRRDEILKLMDNLNATRDEVIEVNNKLQKFSKDLQENKFTKIPEAEKVFLVNWCNTFSNIGERVVLMKNTKYN